MTASLKLSRNPTNQAVTHFIESRNKEIKFGSPKPADNELITNRLLRVRSERKKLEKLDLQFFMNYICAINESQENMVFAKKFYPKRLSLLVSLILSIVASKNLPNDLKYRALKFFHENFDIDEAIIDEILTELEIVDSSHIPFSNFYSEETNDGLLSYDLYNPSQTQIEDPLANNSKKVNPMTALCKELEEVVTEKLDKDNENLHRRLVIKPNPQMRMYDEEEFFNRPGMGSQQNFPGNSQRSLLNPYEILGMEPKYTDESEDDFRKRLRKQYHKLILIHHPDKGGLKEDFQKIHSAYEELNKDLVTENETVRQNSPSRRSA